MGGHQLDHMWVATSHVAKNGIWQWEPSPSALRKQPAVIVRRLLGLSPDCRAVLEGFGATDTKRRQSKEYI